VIVPPGAATLNSSPVTPSVPGRYCTADLRETYIIIHTCGLDDKPGTVYLSLICFAFSALTPLVGRQEVSDEVMVWLSVWSEVQIVCKWSS